QIPAMVAEVARRKALATVLEKVTVKDSAGNAVDLNEAMPEAEGDDTVEVVDDSEPAAEEKADA
ncbi:MAG TPA: hypothetical protein VLS28_02420, partial [Candidatus Sulfomarinibacteraceae bacterium]|nr:hypothetical protein [Candidatus Sulfomarinibacteraceae bacterium]